MRTLTIEIPEGKKAEWVNGILTLVDEAKAKPVTERIKTFEDACKELGEDNSFVKEYRAISKPEMGADLLAYLKLRIIAAALNEGWVPQFTGDEYRYYPWFVLYSKKEWYAFAEEDRRKRGMEICGDADDGAYAVFFYTSSYSSRPNALGLLNLGSHLFFKTWELAQYAGKQFADIWIDFYYSPNRLNHK